MRERVNILRTDPVRFSLSQISRGLDVTLMTLANWRRGSPRIAPLPVSKREVGAAHRVEVRAADLREWLKFNRPDLVQPFERMCRDRHP